ncbi:MAG: bifunctional 3,4-dihydroxy-2-butanone-4-phosphate synthase/GTP cyclohydrolase II [Actinobacteria bacterium]|nr:MAG: bifunctional 3,4-dihydroxy-2-butanone-4-phosphate synthase/GTP cyclohydrolase II [Actinomycetota bacterium]
MSFSTIDEAVAAVKAGRPVVVVDDADRENEGDLIFAAQLATPELMAFMVRHTSGFICAPLSEADADRLELPPMYHTNQDRRGTAYTVTVDAREGVSTGISAADRCHTVRLLSDPATSPADLSRPGHVVPLRAKAGGVLRRPGHTEAAIDLATLAGLRPSAVLCELVNDDGTMMRLPDLEVFVKEHGLVLISIADLIAYRRRTEVLVEQVAQARLPTEFGLFRAFGYRARPDGAEQIALVYGDLGDGADVLVRVHSECLTGDAFGSLRCDCGPQLRAALRRVATEGRGVVLYIRGHEGRGIGLLEKLRAYELQDTGVDTVDANLRLGLPADARDYGTGAQILYDLGVRTMRLLTNNPAKRAGLEGYGLRVVGRVPLPSRPHPENVRYLRTKRDRMGHLLDGLELDKAAEGSA